MAKDTQPTKTEPTKTKTEPELEAPPTGATGAPAISDEDEMLVAAQAVTFKPVLVARDPIDYALPDGKRGRIERGEAIGKRLNREQLEQLVKRGFVENRML